MSVSIMIAQWENGNVSLSVLSLALLWFPEYFKGSLADHTLPTRPVPGWQKMTQSLCDCRHRGRKPIHVQPPTDNDWKICAWMFPCFLRMSLHTHKLTHTRLGRLHIVRTVPIVRRTSPKWPFLGILKKVPAFWTNSWSMCDCRSRSIPKAVLAITSIVNPET